MIINKEHVKRLGIFFFYDKDGIADHYVEYLIKEYAKCQDKLIIVSNGEIRETTRKMFLTYTENVIVRENKGLDVGAYLTAFRSAGWTELETYDEVSIANFTLMGPVYPLIEMYQRMEKEDVDFWGISKHFKFDHDLLGNIPYGYLPEHIQSHYMVFRSSLVKSKEFQDFWDNMPKIEDYRDSVAMFEATFTKRFSDYGFKWDVCSPVEDMKGISYNPIMEYPKELVKNRKCPFFKRRSFFQEHDVVLDTTLGEPVVDLFTFLEEETDYDTDLIWENIIRSCNHADFVKSLHLNYVLNTKNDDSDSVEKDIKTVLLMHLMNEEQIDLSLHYAENVSSDTDIIVITSAKSQPFYKEKFAKIKRNHIIFQECDEESEAECFLKSAKLLENYEIGCYYHDCKGNVVKNSFHYKNAENVLYNKTYVRNVIHTFAQKRFLGLLVPLEPNHADYFPTMGREWHGFFDDVNTVIKELKINVPVSAGKEPVAPFGDIFWFRTSAILKMVPDIQRIKENYEKDRFLHIWKRVLPFICLENGYYPAYVLTDYFSRIELTNTRFYLREYGKFFDRNGITEGTQKAMIRQFEAAYHGQPGIKFAEPRYMRLACKMQKILPKGLYDKLIRIKRKIFGPYDLV